MGHKNRFGDWKAGHAGKRRYATRSQAWAAVFRIWVREGRWDSLQPYTCRWGWRWQLGRTAEPHFHIGHGRYTPGQRARHQLDRRVVWPYFRARRRLRARGLRVLKSVILLRPSD